MTREEAINKWIIPAIENTWNHKKCVEILKALEQEPCICLNEVKYRSVNPVLKSKDKDGFCTIYGFREV